MPPYAGFDADDDFAATHDVDITRATPLAADADITHACIEMPFRCRQIADYDARRRRLIRYACR